MMWIAAGLTMYVALGAYLGYYGFMDDVPFPQWEKRVNILGVLFITPPIICIVCALAILWSRALSV
jgi:hypothetical protein